MARQVTEKDFRKPEFIDANPEDYEFREDGKIVRKDRWEQGIRQIVGHLGAAREHFEIEDVVQLVRQYIDASRDIYKDFSDEEIKAESRSVRLAWNLGSKIENGKDEAIVESKL